MVSDTLARVSALGIATGMKMMSPAAIYSWEVVSGRQSVGSGTPFALLRDRRVAVIASLMAIGEVIADKVLPLPPRTSAGALLPRVAMGAALGGLLAADSDLPAPLGGALGGISGCVGRRRRHSVAARADRCGPV